VRYAHDRAIKRAHGTRYGVWRAMNVVHVEAGMHLYGGAVQVLQLLRGLREAGADGERHILICARASAIAAAAEGSAHRIHAITMRGDGDVGLLRRVRRVLREEQADLVHVHSRRGADIWAGLAARRERIPAILSRRVDNPEKRWLVKFKYGLYQKVITISRGIRQVLIEQAGVAPEKIVCVPSAVDTERFRPGAESTERAWFAHEFNLRADELAVGMLAQFIERKGHRVLFDALPSVLQRVPNTRVLLFGQGPLLEEIKRLCAERGLDKCVVFTGFRQDIDKILPCLDLVVHPALMEGLGVSLLEAAACAAPIIASNAGGMPEIVRDGVNGSLIAPGDSSALAAAMIALLTDRELRQRSGAQGRRLAEAEFSVPAMVAGNYRVYQEVLRAHATSATARVRA
jgi:glycosyltransferase involved in cell wall biosynthesis